jgi:ribosomal protein S18 acetylase RimI-like enzyme
MKIRAYASADEPAVIDLWQRCGLTRAWNDPKKDIQRKLAVRPDLFLVVEEEGAIVGSAMAGYEGHRGWVNYLAVSPGRQRKGIARALMAEVERLLLAEGCPKINLQIRTSNAGAIEFYRKLGYSLDETVSMGKRLIPDN